MKFLIDNSSTGISAYLATEVTVDYDEDTLESNVDSFENKYNSISELQPYLYSLVVEKEDGWTNEIELEEGHFTVDDMTDVSITNDTDEDDYLCVKFKAIVNINFDMDDEIMQDFKADLEQVDYKIQLSYSSVGFSFPDGSNSKDAFDGGYEDELEIKLERI